MTTLPALAEAFPTPDAGTQPGAEDIGRVVTIVTRTIDGPNTGNVDTITGRLILFSYTPPEMHTTHYMPPELAALTGKTEEENTSEHLDPEQIVFRFDGGAGVVIVLSEHEWSYTVHPEK